MNLSILIDAPSAAIVIGGTLTATLLRAGLGDCRVTLGKLVQLGHRAFDADAVRAQLAVQIREIRRDGLLRAPQHHFADPEFEEATDALLHRRSLAALLDKHEAHKARRLAHSERAVRTLAQAAELAPVFGLAGTLVSLSQLSLGVGGSQNFAPAIAMAVVTTLYGLVSANFLFAPLARMVERQAQREERARQQVVDWLAVQLADEVPGRRGPRLAA